MPKVATKKQISMFLSKHSPLSPEEKQRFKEELEAGEIKIIKKKKR